jgi:DNA replication and repair protein RecF
MELMRSETGEYPVVLLDDVMSELDRARRKFLVEILNTKAQTIITTTHLGSFTEDILANASIFRIEAGTIAERGNGDVFAPR